ncbi:MAG: hypothetical protein J6U84_04170 [Bacteroidales bacterium]|nr:hypothetical protein [Bacteroidales bacterium]
MKLKKTTLAVIIASFVLLFSLIGLGLYADYKGNQALEIAKQKGKPLYADKQENEIPLWNLYLGFEDSTFVKPNGDTVVEKMHSFAVSFGFFE